MTRKNYSVRLPDEVVRFSADLVEASAPIWYAIQEDWDPTPFQTADARHRELDAARLVLQYIGGEYADAEITSSDVKEEEE